MGINRDVWGFLAEEGRLKMVLLTLQEGACSSPKGCSRSPLRPDLDDCAPLLPLPVLRHQAHPRRDRPFRGDRGQALLQQTLKEKKKGQVRVHGPSDSGTADMIRLAVENLHEVETRGPRRGVQEDAPPLEGAEQDRGLRHFPYPRAEPVGHHGRLRGLQGEEGRITGSSTYGRRRPRTMWP